MDCMEMGKESSLYKVRFGLNYTGYLNNLNRKPKKSAKWLKSPWLHLNMDWPIYQLQNNYLCDNSQVE